MEINGTIIFDPTALNNSEKLFKRWWMIIKLDDGNELAEYYSWWIKKMYGIIMQKPAFGPHISCIRGEPTSEIIWKEYKEKYNKTNVKFEYTTISTNGKHWWLKVECDLIKNIRQQMGYTRDGMFGLHLTIGSPIPKYLEQSSYIEKYIENWPEHHHPVLCFRNHA